MLDVANGEIGNDEDLFNLIDEPIMMEDLVQEVPELVAIYNPKPAVMQV